MKDTSFLSTEELENAAFYLLTSSSVERYVRIAKNIATQSGVSAQLQANSDLAMPLLVRARQLWRRILLNACRDVPEFELAVLLPVLAKTALPEVSDFLLSLASIDRHNCAWISALARRLCQERPTNVDLAKGYL